MPVEYLCNEISIYYYDHLVSGIVALRVCYINQLLKNIFVQCIGHKGKTGVAGGSRGIASDTNPEGHDFK